MPTPRQRWPNGAEEHRVEALRLADLSERHLEDQYRNLECLVREVGPRIPDNYRAALEEAQKITARVQLWQVKIARELEQARNGTDGNEHSAEPRDNGAPSRRQTTPGRRRA